ncbi:MAG: hypothetical protein ABIF18_00240 [archaeon]
MDKRKRLTILIIVAVILAVTAIALDIMDSEVPTTSDASVAGQDGAGIIGVDIIPGEVEDKLLEAEGQP